MLTNIYIQNSDFWARRQAEWEEFDRQFPDFVAWNNLRNQNEERWSTKLSNPTTESIDPPSDGLLSTAAEVTKLLTTKSVVSQDDSETESDTEFQADLKLLCAAGTDKNVRKVLLQRIFPGAPCKDRN